jgi:hypothetical protein
MKVKVEITDEAGNVQQYDVSSSALYDALARLIGLIEVRPNQWVNEHGEYYTLTKYGFKRYGVGLQS